MAHIIRTQAGLVVGDTLTGSGSGSNTWGYQGPSFLAWDSPQEFTVPFYQLGVNGGDDFIFLPAVNGTPPTVPGFTTWQVVVGYAYATQVCGSVPLFSVVSASGTDHWWTSSQANHAEILASGDGWVDGGIPFYVLPLNFGMSFRS